MLLKFIDIYKKPIVFTALVFILYLWTFNSSFDKLNHEKHVNDGVPKFRKIEYNDGSECYKSYAFQSDEALRYSLKSVFDMNKLLQEENKRKIFFHKTDCIHDGIVKMSKRHACAIESAALTNPTANIFVLYASAVGWLNTTKLPFIDAILSYPNVHLATIDINSNINKYAKDTPISSWLEKNAMLNSMHAQVHMNDFLRDVSLFNYGGTAIDLDVVVLKDLSSLGENFAAHGYYTLIYCGIMNLGLDSVGRDIATNLLKNFIENYSDYYFGANGHWYLMRVLEERCNCTEADFRTLEFTIERCRGFNILPKNYFYANDWQEWKQAFEPVNHEITRNFMTSIKDSYIVHLLEQLSGKTKVKINTGTGYELLARKYCPKVYSLLKDEF